MKKFLLFLFTFNYFFGQVGIGTTTPKAALDIFDWLNKSPAIKNVARMKNFIILPTSNSIIGFYF